MPVIPKIAGSMSIVSSLVDIHKTAMIFSKEEKNKTMGDNVVSRSIGTQKADYVSFKDAKRKNWCNDRKLFFTLKEDFSAVKGYLKGALDGIVRYLPKIALSLGAIIPKKHKYVSYISTIALAGAEIWDFLRYGTGIFERKDYLKRK